MHLQSASAGPRGELGRLALFVDASSHKGMVLAEVLTSVNTGRRAVQRQ